MQTLYEGFELTYQGCHLTLERRDCCATPPKLEVLSFLPCLSTNRARAVFIWSLDGKRRCDTVEGPQIERSRSQYLMTPPKVSQLPEAGDEDSSSHH